MAGKAVEKAHENIENRIRIVANKIHEERMHKGEEGDDISDWLKAEDIVKKEMSSGKK
jgi:hypothetical protein